MKMCILLSVQNYASSGERFKTRVPWILAESDIQKTLWRIWKYERHKDYIDLNCEWGWSAFKKAIKTSEPETPCSLMIKYLVNTKEKLQIDLSGSLESHYKIMPVFFV